MKFYAKSEIGKIRPNNEDAFLAKKINEVYIFLVCDGMGGHNKGEVASQMAIEHVDSAEFNLDGKSDEDILDYIKDLIYHANIKIYLKGKKNLEMLGMGTTFSMALYYRNKIYMAHVGDSRIYVLEDKMKMISKDHTLLNEFKDRGIVLKEDEEKKIKNMITRAVGSSSVVETETSVMDAYDVKKILICSDGVNIYLDDEALEKELMKNETPEKIVSNIIDCALNAGGRDNITCLVAEIGD
ncbi:MAG: protein phosphatase 2C domain-containing protein [Ezakiella sp.]|nr:protein phosphatase 2C domain-containing protein [Ezakiella sp.]MDD7471759.1 protein phosphatase 2C domain-containing protein [Bacillota bacterium]MDY3923511.1 protein phosphatase 2C domain-containing protein [Ezakiella sp.]